MKLMASKSMNDGRTSRGAQGENPLIPKTLSERANKLLTDAQKEAKALSGQSPSQSFPKGEEDSRDAIVRCIQVDNSKY